MAINLFSKKLATREDKSVYEILRRWLAG